MPLAEPPYDLVVRCRCGHLNEPSQEYVFVRSASDPSRHVQARQWFARQTCKECGTRLVTPVGTRHVSHGGR